MIPCRLNRRLIERQPIGERHQLTMQRAGNWPRTAPTFPPSPQRSHLDARRDRLPKSVRLANEPLATVTHSSADRLLWVRFANSATPRELTVSVH